MWDHTRRRFIQSLGVGVASALGGRVASATVVGGLTLEALAQRSDHIVLGTAVASVAHFFTLPGSRRIVTDVRVRVDGVLAKDAPAQSELTVRVLGGVVGKSAEFVDGQAELSYGTACALFLCAAPDSVHWVTGMAQGHFPLLEDAQGTARLCASPHLSDMIHPEQSAVRRLVGTDVPSARELVRRALAP